MGWPVDGAPDDCGGDDCGGDDCRGDDCRGDDCGADCCGDAELFGAVDAVDGGTEPLGGELGAAAGNAVADFVGC